MDAGRGVPLYLAVAVLELAVAVTTPTQGMAQGSKLTDAQLRRQFTDRPFTVRSTRTHVGDPRNPTESRERADGGHIILRIVLRADASASYTCQNHTPSGVRPCDTGGERERREIGVWSVENDAVCWQWLTARESRKNCYSIHREVKGLVARRVSGPWGPTDGSVLQFE